VRLINQNTDPTVVIAALLGVLEALRIYLQDHPSRRVLDMLIDDLDEYLNNNQA